MKFVYESYCCQQLHLSSSTHFCHTRNYASSSMSFRYSTQRPQALATECKLIHKKLRLSVLWSTSMFIISVRSFYSFENRGKSSFHTFLAFGVCCHLVLNAVFSVFLLCIAGANYPGGVAISRLHSLAKDEEFVFVHIDVLTAQTGVSRFTQDNPNWRYQKLWN